MSFSFRQRQKNISDFKNEKFDLAIIGGGITGSGIARDAASRGMKVALIEARDFAEGTSSRSSKLIHGGIRYLENFEFGLVFEALSERALLFKIAPHLVHPLRFMIPIYESSRVGYWQMLAGMWLYDILAMFETPQIHESLSREESLERIPELNGRGLTGSMEYSDAYTDDDRLVVETLRDAHRMGAKSANYVRVVGSNRDEQKIKTLKLRDELSGEEFDLQADQVVSGVGPWTDILGQGFDKDWKPTLRPTKGVHLVFSRKRIPVKKAVVMAVEKRIIFVIPRHEMVIVGTTDTDFSGDPKDVSVTPDDVSYLLGALNNYFPKFAVQAEHIISSYAGVRPLVDDGSSTEGKTSREHKIWSHGPNLTFVAGGKYTTYRKISEDAVDHILNKCDFDKKMAFSPSQTKKPLNPQISQSLYARAKMSIEAMAERYEKDPDLVAQLVFRHGEEADKILKSIDEKYRHYSANEAYWMGEADFAIDNTMCLSLRDFWWRRAPLFLASRDHGMTYLNCIAQVFKEKLGLSEEAIEDQKKDLMEQMQHELSWRR